MPQTSIEPPAPKASSRIQEIRRRIRERYYDRAEVRRALSSLLLRQLARAGESRKS